MPLKLLAGIAALVSALAVDRAGATTLIDFEAVPGLTASGSFLGGNPVPANARLTTQLRLSHGVSFSSTPGYAAYLALGAGHATSGTNGIGGVSAAGALDYNELIITFTLPGNPLTDAVADAVSIRGDFSPAISGGTATMQAFDVNGLLLGSVTVPDTAGPTLSLSVAGIHSLRITETSGTIAFDDLSFGDLAAIPEPEPSALLGLGIGLLVTFRRRRRL